MAATRLAPTVAPCGSDLPPPNLIFPSSMRTRKRRPAFITGKIRAPNFNEVDPSIECNRPPNAAEFLKTSFFADTQAPNPYASTAPGAAWSDSGRPSSKPSIRPRIGLTRLDTRAYRCLEVGLDPTDGKAPVGVDGLHYARVVAHRGDQRVEEEQTADAPTVDKPNGSLTDILIILTAPEEPDFSLWSNSNPARFNPTALSPMDANRDKWGVIVDKKGQVLAATDEEKLVDGWLAAKMAERVGWKSEKMAGNKVKQGKETVMEEQPVRRERW